MNPRGAFVGLCLLGIGLSTNGAIACPFCGPPQSRLSERLAKNEVSVLAEWIESSPGKNAAGGSTRFRIIERTRGPAGKFFFANGDRLTLPRDWRAEPGERCLLFGRKEDELLWETPVSVSDAAYRYVVNAPATDQPVGQRLEYYVRFLESNDSLISLDALAEFATAPYSDVAALAKKLPREKLRA